MLVRCPQCKTEFRLVDYSPEDRVVKYLCPGCQEIVRIDLEMDEIQSSSSSGSYRTIHRKKTVLVADDSDTITGLCEKILQDAGFNVLVATDGVETLRLVREEHPDLVVLDLLMPRMTGFDVLREIRQDDRVRETPILAMSSVYKDDILGFLHQLGAQGFLDKQQIRDSLAFRAQSLLSSPNPA